MPAVPAEDLAPALHGAESVRPGDGADAVVVAVRGVGVLGEAGLEYEDVAAGAELLISGHVNVISKKPKEIYLYQDFYYNDVEMVLNVYRIDTGELIDSEKAFLKSTDRVLEESINKSLREITALVSKRVADEFNASWNYMMLDQADYRIMVTGVNADDVGLIKETIRSMPAAKTNGEFEEGKIIVHPKVFMRSYYSDVAILSVVHKGPRQNLIDLLTSIQHPRLVLVDDDKADIWLEQVR